MTASNPSFNLPSVAHAGAAVRWSLWIAQGFLAALYLWSASMKLLQSPVELAAMMPWANQVPEGFLRFIGAVDLAAGLGILLPALTRIAPRLTLWAAAGSIVLQIFAMVFHSARSEFMVLPLNGVLLVLSVYVLWGRGRKAPIAARR
jgi:hypothetical protein